MSLTPSFEVAAEIYERIDDAIAMRTFLRRDNRPLDTWWVVRVEWPGVADAWSLSRTAIVGHHLTGTQLCAWVNRGATVTIWATLTD